MKDIIEEIQAKKIYKYIIVGIILLALSGIIMGITFALSSAQLNSSLYKSYIRSPLLMTMNLIPILFFMTLLYLISNSLWLSYSVTALLFVIMGIVNKIKLTYRDDPFVFIDLKLAGESIEMAGRYDFSLSTRWIIILLGLMIISIILKKIVKFEITSLKSRMVCGLTLLIASLIGINGFYFDSNLYAKLGDKDQINRWIQSEDFQSKGFVYPFLYSLKDVREKEPDGYNEEEIKKSLGKYEYKDIEEDKKINLVTIMLEAYNDFSEFEDVEINQDIYEYFHRLQEESISGKLVTNVFAGGTIDTERGFLTGYYHHPKYLKETNSFPWYMKEQGYKTEAMHPITGSFYNRRNINEYIGFENFDYYENKYKEIQEDYLMDMNFFDFIIEGYQDSIEEGRPYFHYSITYQNHGPYSDEKLIEEEYLKRKAKYNEEDYNIVNNYLSGIYETNQALEKLVDHFSSSKEPVVLVLFGDHNPWLGTNNSCYNMLDINIDLGTVDGFKNYYETPYVIWGNQAAKEVAETEFQGEGLTLSPNHLMAQTFDYIGWEGNEYMQYIRSLKEELPVNHLLYFMEEEQLIPSQETSHHIKELWQDFINVEYYMKTNFSGNKTRKD